MFSFIFLSINLQANLAEEILYKGRNFLFPIEVKTKSVNILFFFQS